MKYWKTFQKSSTHGAAVYCFKTLLIAFERERVTHPTPAASNCSIAGLEPLALRISAFGGYTLQKMKDPASLIQDMAQEGLL